MKIEDLAELTPDKLEALTDDELDKILRPLYAITRPECIVKTKSVTSHNNESNQLYLSPEKRAFIEHLREQGEDVDYLLRGRKKK